MVLMKINKIISDNKTFNLKICMKMKANKSYAKNLFQIRFMAVF